MNQAELDANLMVVTAVQGYAENHHILETEAYEIFKKNDLFLLIRNQYEALHTQPLEDCIAFAEDIINKAK